MIVQIQTSFTMKFNNSIRLPGSVVSKQDLNAETVLLSHFLLFAFTFYHKIQTINAVLTLKCGVTDRCVAASLQVSSTLIQVTVQNKYEISSEGVERCHGRGDVGTRKL